MLAPRWARAASSADDLLRLYVQWRGGRAFQRVRLISTVARLRLEGLDTVRTIWVDGNDRYAERLAAGVIRTQFVATKDATWFQTPDGRTDSADASSGEPKRRLAGMLSPWILDADWKSAGSERRYGQEWGVISAVFPGSVMVDLFIDTRSGALGGARVREPAGGHFSRYEDWREVSGVRMPFVEQTETIELDNGQPIVVEKLSYSSIRINAAPPPGTFEPPRSPATVRFATPEGRTGKIAFGPGSDVIFMAEIAGRSVQALLDSGASVSHIDVGFARAVGLQGTGEFQAPGTSGATVAVQAAECPPITMGRMTASGLRVGLTDLAPARASLGRPIEAILGQDIFDHVVVEIDFGAGHVEFVEPTRYRPAAGARSLPIGRVGSVPTVQVEFEDVGPADFALDLGNAAASLVLYGSFWKPREMLARRHWSTIMSADIAGSREVKQASISTVVFGDWTFRDLPALFVDLDKGKGSERLAGNIGLPILDRFTLAFDYPSGRLYLSPNTSIERPFTSVSALP